MTLNKVNTWIDNNKFRGCECMFKGHKLIKLVKEITRNGRNNIFRVAFIM